MIKITKDKNTRFWAVWMKDELVAVVCYKKGARAIQALLTEGLTGKTIENLTRQNFRSDLGAIQRLARALNQRIANTANRLNNPHR